MDAKVAQRASAGAPKKTSRRRTRPDGHGTPHASRQADAKGLCEHAWVDRDLAWLAAAVAHVDAPRGALDLPLDLHGTVFQQRVWQALRGIPAGATATYAEIAARIGAPRAARAVAQACASNPVAMAVPCHRVVRGDGGAGGYRWGVERKRALLRRESGD